MTSFPLQIFSGMLVLTGTERFAESFIENSQNYFVQNQFVQAVWSKALRPTLFYPKKCFPTSIISTKAFIHTTSCTGWRSAPSQVFKDIDRILVLLVTERNPLDPLRYRAIFLPLWFPQGLPLTILPDHSFRCVLLSFKFTEK